MGSRLQATPIVSHSPEGDIAVFTSVRGGVLAIEPVTGDLQWASDIASDVAGPLVGKPCVVSTLSGGTVAYFGKGSYLVAVDLSDGEVLSSIKVGGESLEAGDEEEERRPRRMPPDEIQSLTLSPPQVGVDGKGFHVLLVACTQSGLFAFEVALDHAHFLGSPLWRADTEALDIQSAPLWRDGRVFIGGYKRTMSALDGLSGELLWETTVADVVSTATTSIDGEVVYFGSSDGFLYAHSPLDGRLKWKQRVGFSVQSAPVIGNDGSIVVTGTFPSTPRRGPPAPRVVAFDSTGNRAWSVTTRGMVFSSVARGAAPQDQCAVFFGDTEGCVSAAAHCAVFCCCCCALPALLIPASSIAQM